MKQTVGIILIIAGLALGYFAYDKMQNSKAGIKIGELEISATDKSSNETSYILFGLAAISLLGGIVMLSKNKALQPTPTILYEKNGNRRKIYSRSEFNLDSLSCELLPY